MSPSKQDERVNTEKSKHNLSQEETTEFLLKIEL